MRPVRQREHSIEGSWLRHVHVLEYASNVAHQPAVWRQVKIKVNIVVFDSGASYIRRRELGALIISDLDIMLHIHLIFIIQSSVLSDITFKPDSSDLGCGSL